MSWIIANILPFIIVLSILVFVHEYGHFWVARRNGVRVSVFSIGFGPELFGWTDKHQTRWRISPIPLGGYVKFLGDSDVSSTTVDARLADSLSDEEKSMMLHNKTPLQRIAVSAAGPLANYLFAIVVLAALVSIKGVPTYEPIVIVSSVMKGELAEKIGIQQHDKILRFGETEIKSTPDLMKALAEHAGKDVAVTLDRKGESVVVKASLYKKKENSTETVPVKKLGIGITQGEPTYKSTSVFKALGYAVTYCFDLSIGMLKGLWMMIVGSAGAEMGGILSIGDMAAQSVQHGFATLIIFMAMLSVNLGLINLLPIPVLDGGHILFCLIELARGRPLSEKMQENIFKGGALIVIGVMLYSTFSDLLRYKVFAFVGKLFG